MFNLRIHNFGPILDADIDINRLELFIGPQSSGKSTIAKLVYFFLHVRDEVTSFILEEPQNSDSEEIEQVLQKRLRSIFKGLFGTVLLDKDAKIKFTYFGDHHLEISPNKSHHQYLNFSFSECMRKELLELILEAKHKQQSISNNPERISALDSFFANEKRKAISEMVRKKSNNIFGFDKELLFIPAGRSLLSTLSDQLQFIHPDQLDFSMRRFVEIVNAYKIVFDKSLSDLILEKQALSSKQLLISALNKTQYYIKRILRGEYRHDKEGGKIHISSEHYTRLSFASSGQQEVVWILLSLFLLVLNNSKTLVFIEEPEAHLFPSAQKEIMDFIAFVFNEIDCDFIITTHSPYLLSCVNNLLYAHDLGRARKAKGISEIVPDDRWLSPSSVGGHFVNKGTAAALVNEEAGALKTELLDSASAEINEQFEQLLDIERGMCEHEG